MINEYMHILFNLFAVLALIVVTMLVTKKIKSNRNGPRKHIQLTQVVSVGPKEKILFVEANGVSLLLGATAHRIDVLHVYDRANSSLATEKEFPDIMRHLKDTSSI